MQICSVYNDVGAQFVFLLFSTSVRNHGNTVDCFRPEPLQRNHTKLENDKFVKFPYMSTLRLIVLLTLFSSTRNFTRGVREKNHFIGYDF